ncbi:MAG: aminoacyl-tRNA hydrolase [bacterium]|nr:aminoacyl-tRNA hydrolase [bacterium]
MDTEAPLLVVGLGNPGSRYRDTRHNVGFLVVEELARRLGWTFTDGAGPWREASASDGRGPFVLLEPLTYMNLSGQAVAAWARGRGWPVAPPPLPEASWAPEAPVAPEADVEAATPSPWQPAWRPLVICDDLALPLGALRLRARGSSGGQKGLASVIDELGHDDFPRLRLGIAPPDLAIPAVEWPDFVLTPFAADERPFVTDLVSRAADAVDCCRELGLEAAASRFNRRQA